MAWPSVLPALADVVSVSVNATADGVNSLVAAPGADRRLAVLGFIVTATAAGIYLIQSSTGVVGPRLQVPINGGVVAPTSEVPYFIFGFNQGIDVNCPTGGDAFGSLTYALLLD